MAAYYNENDPYAAAWLRNLIAAGHIAAGDVDERSIVDVRPDDLRGYAQCHFFAGLGGWSYALRLAGWPDDRPVWTGSCPCQPFSAAGKRGGAADKRHLWPAWAALIRECRPATVFGEQVEGAVRLGWLDLVFGDLEAEGYACGAAVFGAHSVGAPHIRQRLYWVADASSARRFGPLGETEGQARDEARMRVSGEDGGDGRLADADGWLAGDGDLQRGGQHGQQPEDGGAGERLADADDTRSQGRRLGGDGPGERAAGADGVAGRLADAGRERRQQVAGGASGDEGADGRRAQGNHVAASSGADGWSTATAGFWRDPDWLYCRDGKWRPVESGTFPLVDGAPARVGRLRAYGNAIVPQVAAAFVRAIIDAMRAA